MKHGEISDRRRLRVLLVDPSLFTAPYDAALTEGLLEASVSVTWAARQTRDGDRPEIPDEYLEPLFYRHVDRLRVPERVRSVLKGLSHGVGLFRLVSRVRKLRPDLVHFQWLVVPSLDALAIWVIQRTCPVVLTVHDTVPFNGESMPALQKHGLDFATRLFDRIIVHTHSGRALLEQRGIPRERLRVIPHGPLRLPEQAPPSGVTKNANVWTFLLFGEIKHYKGPDVLIEAVGKLPPELRRRARFVIAGRPRMPVEPLLERITALGLDDVVEVRPRRLSEPEMAELFAETDCFVFPYRHIDASGVYYLAKPLAKWIIASRVGVFAEELEDGAAGELVEPEAPLALSRALERAIRERPAVSATADSYSWTRIGHATRELYSQVRA